jgi:hypothetical protein
MEENAMKSISELASTMGKIWVSLNLVQEPRLWGSIISHHYRWGPWCYLRSHYRSYGTEFHHLAAGWKPQVLLQVLVVLVVPCFASPCRCRNKPVIAMRITMEASPAMALGDLLAQQVIGAVPWLCSSSCPPSH